MTDLTDRLDQIEARAEAATPGPWEADVTEVSQHWSRPKPWVTVVSSEVACMAYCYGGSGRGIERETDAEFIAAARTDVPTLVAALRAVLDLHCDAGPSQGYDFGPDGGYGWADHCCATCGAHGEYGVEWPCPTVQAIADALGVEP